MSTARPDLKKDTRGVVYVEFLLVFPPLFLFFLIILQAALLRASDLGVSHAASAAARSAVVVLPDDPHFYGKEDVNEITETSKCSEGFVGKLHKLLGSVGVNSLTVPDDGKCLGGARMDAIRFAAIIRMLPFSPNASHFFPESVMSAVGQLGQAGWVAGAAMYSYGATSVTFPEAPGSEELRTSLTFEPEEPLGPPPLITVRVSYLAHCGIPLARYLMCDSSHRLALGIGVDKQHVQAAKGLAKGVGSRVLLGGLIASGERFRVLRADATLPLNSAAYVYKLKE